jgi:hypothetical protein
VFRPACDGRCEPVSGQPPRIVTVDATGSGGPEGHFGTTAQTLPFDGDRGSGRSDVGLKLEMVASYGTIVMVVVARWMVALVAADRLKVKVPGVARLQLRRSTRTAWIVWPGVKVRVPAVLPGLGTPT